jgi:alkaline phosphatase
LEICAGYSLNVSFFVSHTDIFFDSCIVCSQIPLHECKFGCDSLTPKKCNLIGVEMKQRIGLVLLLMAVVMLSVACQKAENKDTAKVKNVILLIGDGMGLPQVNAVRLQVLGRSGRLTIEQMPVTGIITTDAADYIITDSAAGATAFATGHKTNNRMVSVLPDSTAVKTILEAFQEAGMKTGLVATSGLTHATPACFAAHVDLRHKYAEIAEQMIATAPQVMFAGGREYFIPQTAEGSKREDDVDLLKKADEAGYQVITEKAELTGLNAKDKALGLFRLGALENKDPEPSLSELTHKAIELLAFEGNGFFLMVEGSQIDWAGHANDFDYLQREMMSFDDAVKTALEFAQKDGETLVIVTADHETGGIHITGGKENEVEVSFISTHHTGTPVPVYAYGPGAMTFTGFYDNTDLVKKIDDLVGLEGFPQE